MSLLYTFTYHTIAVTAIFGLLFTGYDRFRMRSQVLFGLLDRLSYFQDHRWRHGPDYILRSLWLWYTSRWCNCYVSRSIVFVNLKFQGRNKNFVTSFCVFITLLLQYKFMTTWSSWSFSCTRWFPLCISFHPLY